MIEHVKQYFSAWESKNIDLLKQVLTPGDFGIRTFHKEVVFDIEHLSNVLLDSNVIHVDILNITELTNQIIVEAIYTMVDHKEHISIKFTFISGKIFKVYEVVKDTSVRRIKCVVSYDGSMCFGFQRQPNFTTVQGTLEQALKEITNEDITIHASGRTDRGVHSLNQVFHFDTQSKINPSTFYQVLNKHLPEWIKVKTSTQAHATFHSRYDVKTKEYMYLLNLNSFDVIKRNYEWYPGTFNKEVFCEELHQLLGTHDFASFTTTNAGFSTKRTIFSVRCDEVDGVLRIYIKGNGFLRYMVRNIVVACMLIAKGKVSYNIKDLLEAKDNTILKDIAPSSGLYLYEVNYFGE